MKAKDAAVTVTSVQKDPDDSYDVYGTKAGAQVAYDVSADLNTFTARTGGPRRARTAPAGTGGGAGGGRPVTGDEAEAGPPTRSRPRTPPSRSRAFGGTLTARTTCSARRPARPMDVRGART